MNDTDFGRQVEDKRDRRRPKATQNQPGRDQWDRGDLNQTGLNRVKREWLG